jgi:hypothetical protein
MTSKENHLSMEFLFGNLLLLFQATGLTTQLCRPLLQKPLKKIEHSCPEITINRGIYRQPRDVITYSPTPSSPSWAEYVLEQRAKANY